MWLILEVLWYKVKLLLLVGWQNLLCSQQWKFHQNDNNSISLWNLGHISHRIHEPIIQIMKKWFALSCKKTMRSGHSFAHATTVECIIRIMIKRQRIFTSLLAHKAFLNWVSGSLNFFLIFCMVIDSSIVFMRASFIIIIASVNITVLNRPQLLMAYCWIIEGQDIWWWFQRESLSHKDFTKLIYQCEW